MKKSKAIWQVAALLLSAALSAAQVGGIRFEQTGADRLTDEQMLLNIRLRKGSEYKREILDEDVKRLYRTGNFADVAAEVEDMADGQVRLVFKVRLKPRISTLKLVGNAKFSTHDLAKELTVAEGALLNDLELRKTLNNLRKFYHDRGYKDATVSFAQIADGPGRAALTIKITENLRLDLGYNFIRMNNEHYYVTYAADPNDKTRTNSKRMSCRNGFSHLASATLSYSF